MAERSFRRVVSGLGEDGKSAIVIDGEVPAATGMAGRSRVVWRTAQVPADNTGVADINTGTVSVASLSEGGSLFMIQTFPPDHGLGAPFWHATDSIDYITMLSGEVTFITETGETALRAGDVLVDRGIVHAWRNDSEVDAVAAIVIVPAKPVGKGRTH